MKLAQDQTFGWRVTMTNPPKFTAPQWYMAAVVGGLLFIMAVLQLVSFADFRDGLGSLGLGIPTLWAILIILAELWGSASFFKWRLSYAFRLASVGLAVAVTSFWFFVNIQVLANGVADTISSSFFFGRFLNQMPGWWTVIETSLLLFVMIFFAGLSEASLNAAKAKRK